MSNKKTIETDDDVLDIVYGVKDEIEFEVSATGIVTILKKQDKGIQRFFRKLKFKIPEYTRIELDERSSFVFRQIDAQRTVREIGELVDKEFKEQAHPLYENLLLFLNHIEVNEKYIEKK
ncbi:PqqD family peptide modification chaperone [Erysipelotrichaceae bacterium OttesenSCG-928-M19]|nr:PqqD family peptide modification chaperone [Erysipelotrichaceae bacterium OttesenSCG-928-M19]